jgi:hypothetical protein
MVPLLYILQLHILFSTPELFFKDKRSSFSSKRMFEQSLIQCGTLILSTILKIGGGGTCASAEESEKITV